MGNRGILHGADRDLGPARWRHRNWVCCVLSFKERKRVLMAPNRYTELFFLDEATALAAGHRPCAECRRDDYKRFKSYWPEPVRYASEMDEYLHAARAHRGGRKLRTWSFDAAQLPDFTFVRTGNGVLLLMAQAAVVFSMGGYCASRARPTGEVQVLTSAPVVDVLRAGYRPVLHPSAASLI